MSNPIIEVSGLSKQCRIGTKMPYKTFREAIMNAIISPARFLKYVSMKLAYKRRMYIK